MYIGLTTKDKTAETMGRYVNQSFSWILGPLQLVPNKNLQKKFAFYPTFRSLAKKQESFHFFAKFRFNLIREEMRNFRGTENEKFCEKMWNLKNSLFLREFIKKTKYRITKFVFEKFRFFSHFSLYSFSRKSWRYANKIFAFFPRNVSFAANPITNQ